MTDTITVSVGSVGKVEIGISAQFSNDTSNAFSWMSFALSGANTLAASDSNAIHYQANTTNSDWQFGKTLLITGLVAGPTTIKAKYKVVTGGNGEGTGSFKYRKIHAITY